MMDRLRYRYCASAVVRERPCFTFSFIGGHDIRVQPQPAIPDLDNLNTSLPRAGPVCKFLYTGGFGTIRCCLFFLLTPFALVVGESPSEGIE